MAFFEDLGNAINDAAKAVSNKTTEVVEVTKLNNKVNECNKEINQKYIEMGKKIYAKYSTQEDTCEEFKEQCERIAELQKDLEELKIQISNAKGCKVCPNCQGKVDKDSRFCPKCGGSF